MSITISNCDQICKSPTNNSPAKMLYSFSKTARFHSRKIIQCDRYYDIPSTVNSCRTTSFGFGQKYDFSNDLTKNPPPNTYNAQSCFTPNSTNGFGFGKGREQMEITGPLASVKINKNPGPGSYQLGTTLTRSAYSLKGRLHEQDKEKSKIPGPGSYPISFCINQKGTYFLSKYKSSCVRDFSKIQGRPQKLHENKIPGPGSYDTSNIDLSPSGKYVVSKMQNCLARKFTITTRKPLGERNDVPGPGNYQLPSEFGYYVAKNYLESSQTSSKKRQQNEKSPKVIENKIKQEGKENNHEKPKQKTEITEKQGTKTVESENKQ